MTPRRDSFSVRLDDGVLELTLDTPGCSHNIFNLDAAAQLCRILDAADPREVSVILIRSSKPRSFINGVGLLMAGTAQRPEDIPAMTRGVACAYRALREFPAPSVAVITGNCYGCGVEFALHCDYRLACESYDTHFYMTEVADYLFIPAFGATQDLPRLLGLQAASDLLLWGERWSARQATDRGLVDRSFAAHEFESGVNRFVRALAAAPGKRPNPMRESWGHRQEEGIAATQRRIEQLPPACQPLYRETHRLMVNSAKATSVSPTDYADELRSCSESVIQPIAKASVAFFFIRQLATHYCLRGYELPETTQVAMDPADLGIAQLRRELIDRCVSGLSVVEARSEQTTFEVSSLPINGATLKPGVAGAILQPRSRQSAQAECVIYRPFADEASRLVEIAGVAARPAFARVLFAVLNRAGYCPVVSHPTTDFATNLLLAHYLAPLIATVATGAAAADVHASLREFGFVRGVASLLHCIPADQLQRWLVPLVAIDAEQISVAAAALTITTHEGGKARENVIDALLISLGAFAVEAITNGDVPHPALVDVMARELLDFPLMHGSLCRVLDHAELARLADRSAALNCFSAAYAARATHLLKSAHAFYNGAANADHARASRRRDNVERETGSQWGWIPRASQS